MNGAHGAAKPALPATAEPTREELDCLVAFLETGSDQLTLGEMRERCAAPGPAVSTRDPGYAKGVAERRLGAEREAAARPFSLLAHHPNYILGAAYNFDGWDPTLQREATDDPGYFNEDFEIQFQLSFKVPLATDLMDGRMDVFAAYTNRSFWQAYNSEYSYPFRETNHAPELWAQFHNQWQVVGFTNVLNSVGWVHQSNGQSQPLSRSWDRLYANFVFQRRDLALSFKPWIIVSGDSAGGDNPDIEDFMGHGEIRAAWERDGHVLSAMIRNQFESGFEEGATELSWSFPVFGYPYFKGYLQYFYGYGESLIDYDRKVNRLGVGISVTDWLD